MKSAEHKVSVIVPIYNAEKYLQDCIDSILGQSHSNVELILVDDGSSDRTAEICDKNATQDDRIVVIHQENAGVSNARNIGLQRAGGNYITFVDADDTLQKNAITTMLRHAIKHKVDIVRTNCLTIRNKVRKFEPLDEGLYEKDEIKEIIRKTLAGDIKGYVWLLLIKKDFLIKSGALFDPNLAMMEDTKFYIDILRQCSSVYLSNDITYYYVLNTTSASRNSSNYKRNISNLIDINSYFARTLKKDIADIEPTLNATHAIAMTSQIATSIEFPKPDFTTAKKNLKWLQQKEEFHHYCKTGNFTNTSLYSKIVLYTVRHRLTLATLILFSIRSIIRKFR